MKSTETKLSERLTTEEAVSSGGTSRRSFLKYTGLAAAGGAAVFSLPKLAAANAWLDPVPRWLTMPPRVDRWFWKKVQKEFTLDPQLVYMNIGTTGSMPRRVLKNYDCYNRIVAKSPWDRGGEFPSTTDMRQTIAPGFGCDYKELWMTENTTNGLAQIFNGLPFEAGDVILTTIHEHGAGTSPMNRLRDRFGVVIEYLELPTYDATGKSDFVDVFEAGIEKVIEDTGSPPRLIFFSHTTYKTGTALPAKELCALARDYGITTLIDGAHNTGMFNLQFDDIGCDFYSGSGHKWQCGPGRTGIGYVRNQGGDLPVVWVTEGGYREGAHLRQEGDDIAGLLQSHGNPNYPAYRALNDSCMFWDAIGRQNIQDYIFALSTYTKQRLSEVFGGTNLKLYSADVPGLTSGLTTFNAFDDHTNFDKIYEFRERLREEYGYVIRYTNFFLTNEQRLAGGPYTYANRISTHLFNDFKQVDGLLDAMYDLYLDMGP